MGITQEAIKADNRFSLKTAALKEPYADLASDVIKGLSGATKTLPPKYFYDEHGSKLFDKICATKEYYPTRAESALLESSAVNIMKSARPEHIIELGSGVSRKTRHLLDACEHLDVLVEYHPVDICGEIIEHAGQQLSRYYEWLNIRGLVADYCEDMSALQDHEEPRLFVFLGGTFGNFHEKEALNFLNELKSIMRPDDRFLLGFDRVKDHDVLSSAYNDSQGLTAEFNKNVLTVINRELSADFNLEYFEHHAWFNEKESRIEMHLRSTRDQQVSIAALNKKIDFTAGETIMTEISRKFTPENIGSLLQKANMKITDAFHPEDNYFSLVMAQPA
jgi:L-histidine N-alpha-methyltransferase